MEAQTTPPPARSPEETKKLYTLIRETNKLHDEQKAANNAYEKSRKALLKMMGDEKHIEFKHDNGDVFVADVGASVRDAINVAKLETFVSPKLVKPFLQIPIGVVEAKWGKEIADNSKEPKAGEINVSIKRIPYTEDAQLA